MLAGVILLEALSILLFAWLLIAKQENDLQARTQRRLEFESAMLSQQAREALLEGRPGWIGLSAKMMVADPSVLTAKVTDPAGNVLFVGSGDADLTRLNSIERQQVPLIGQRRARVFSLARQRLESVSPIYTGGTLRGFAWVENNRDWGYEQLDAISRGTAIFGIIWMGASIILVWVLGSSISRPLATLHRGTRALMTSPDSGSFPLPVTVNNEVGELIEAFNRMVASIEEQRGGLNDTLSLLDSMLANAPIGLAFFDRRCRMVRVNQVFAEMNGVPLSRHLGRTLPELLAEPVAQQLETAVQRVFAGEPYVRDQEIRGTGSDHNQRSWTWLVSAYPVRTTPNQVRWVGVIVMDASERKRSEEALRRSEKLAATGRLAASISHEINNPLEAITNLLFLLRNFCPLEEQAQRYVSMAEHEARRISEITQQTLRFYRQSTLPARTNMGELLDSVLSLFQVRLNTLGIRVEREYDPAMDLFCFAGEVRQVIANLVGNAIDATSSGGRLIVRARRSRNWKDSLHEGVRITVADTGTGIEAQLRHRIFEAFFTTKEETGTGLGLWVSHEIILKHQGLVHLRSRDTASGHPTGTVFQIFFPDNEDLVATPMQLPAVAAEA
jgi:PAS domain S-box-containing protein